MMMLELACKYISLLVGEETINDAYMSNHYLSSNLGTPNPNPYFNNFFII